MNRSMASLGVRVVVAALMVVVVSGCGLFGGSSGGSTPTGVQGVETPTSISVVSANNAD